jgi:hypothetical protein
MSLIERSCHDSLTLYVTFLQHDPEGIVAAMVPVDPELDAMMDKPGGGRGKYPRRRSEVPFEEADEDAEEGAEGGPGTATGVSRRTASYSTQENSYTPRDKEARVRFLIVPIVLSVRTDYIHSLTPPTLSLHSSPSPSLLP